jgi:hypothetical protein
MPSAATERCAVYTFVRVGSVAFALAVFFPLTGVDSAATDIAQQMK